MFGGPLNSFLLLDVVELAMTYSTSNGIQKSRL